MTKLIKKMRKTLKYKEWRRKVLKRDFPTYDDKMIKKKQIQVHHLKKVSQIFIDNHISTEEQAFQCKELWRVKNGVSITRGEHFLLTRIERHKYCTRGFIESLEEFVNDRKMKL
ncbi:MAG: hypothetical protein GY861_18145 [bacterium]|nr:hypothetical protein [bacterium]